MKLPGQHTRIKFCGMRRAQDVQAAVQLGVDYVGFVLVPGTRRAVEAEQVLRIQSEVDCSSVCRVGVFRDQPVDEINRLVEKLSLDLVQLHGEEDASLSAQIAVPVILMVPVPAVRSDQMLRNRPDESLVRENLYAILLDSSNPNGASGGLGLLADALAVEQVRASIPPERHFILAGGLTPQNVRAIVDRHLPDAVDVSSGIETQPGIKDAERMRAFVQAVRAGKAS